MRAVLIQHEKSVGKAPSVQSGSKASLMFSNPSIIWWSGTILFLGLKKKLPNQIFGYKISQICHGLKIFKSIKVVSIKFHHVLKILNNFQNLSFDIENLGPNHSCRLPLVLPPCHCWPRSLPSPLKNKILHVRNNLISQFHAFDVIFVILASQFEKIILFVVRTRSRST